MGSIAMLERTHDRAPSRETPAGVRHTATRESTMNKDMSTEQIPSKTCTNPTATTRCSRASR